MIRILIPLDGSPAAEEALKHAFWVARSFPAQLTLLRVISASDVDASVRMDSVDIALRRLQANAYFRGLLKKYAGEGHSVQVEVAEGSPAESIVQFIRETKPDLLVLTRYGRGDATSFASGGTAQKIISSASCSVLLLDPRRPTDPKQEYRRILVPVDDSRDSDVAVAVAAMIAEVHGASLLLLNVIGEPTPPRGLPATRHARQLVKEMHRIIQDEAQRRLRELAAKIPGNITVQTRVLAAPDVSFAIESVAEDNDSDLLMLHTMDDGPESGRVFGSINRSLIQHSHRPLFIFRPSASEGFVSHFRSVFLGEHRLQVG